jgi:NADPH:quinone reductase-like Zn-dependent oxidoreductase
MKAFQFVDFRKPGELRDVPVPEPGPGQVLVKVGGAGACHSDLHILEMEKPAAGAGSFKIPFTLGHENAGWVEKLGPGSNRVRAWRPSDRLWALGLRPLHELPRGHGELLPKAWWSNSRRPRQVRRRDG